MRFLISTLLAAVCLLVPAGAEARQGDPIKEKLDRVRADNETRMQAARTKLADAIEAAAKKAAEKENLTEVKRLESQKGEFLNEGKLPSSGLVVKARAAYEGEIKASKDALKKALQEARTAYIKARKVAEAEAIGTELAALSPIYRPPVKEPPPDDPIAGNWRISIGAFGERRFESDKTRNLNVRLDRGGGANVPGLGWRRSGPGYTIVFPNGATGQVRLGPKGENFQGRMSDGKSIRGVRQF